MQVNNNTMKTDCWLHLQTLHFIHHTQNEDLT